ncbi:MAG: hypothetical protein RJB57_800 [Actinomycetota bacterium]
MHKRTARDASLGPPVESLSVATPSARRGEFSLIGFPTTVRPGFPLFLLLIAVIYPWPLGAWVAGCIAVFTVVHELGHAVTARIFGCEARISLDFMVAYAAFSPAPGFTRLHRGLVAVSGAAAQMSLSAGVLLAMGVNPLSRADVAAASDAAAAVWWTGLVLGAVNLLPVVPLDGGAVVASALDRLFPGRGQRIMLRASIVITSAALATTLAYGGGDFVLFLGFVLFLQWRTLRAETVFEAAVDAAVEAPTGWSVIDAAAAERILVAGNPRGALARCQEAWLEGPTADTAVVAARASSVLGDPGAALVWVEAAVSTSFDDLDTLSRLNAADELAALRGHPRYVSAVSRLN